MPVHIRKFMCMEVKNKIEKRNERMQKQNSENSYDISEMKNISPSQVQNMNRKAKNQNISPSKTQTDANVNISKLRNKFS